MITTGAANLDRLLTALDASTNLAGLGLRGFDLSGLDLSGIDFSGLDLSCAKFDGAINFNPAGIASLFGSDLRGVSFAAGFDKVLSNIELRFADLSGLDLSGFSFEGLNLKGLKLGDAMVQGANFVNSLLQGLDLSAVKDLDTADLKGAFYDGLTRVGSAVTSLLQNMGVLAEIPEDLFFTPYDGPVFRFTGGFDPDPSKLKASIGVELHLRQIFDFGFDFSAASLGLSDFDLGPIHIDADTLLQGDFKLKAGMGVDFGALFGVYLAELPGLIKNDESVTGAAFLQLDSIRAGAGVKAGFDLTADLGFVSGGVIGGTASLTAGIVGDLKDGADSKLGTELRLNALSGVSLGFDKRAELHVALPVDIAVGDFHLSGLGVTPTLRIDDDNLFIDPGPAFNRQEFLDDLKRVALGALTSDINFLVGPDGVLRELTEGIQGFTKESVFGALPFPFLPKNDITIAVDTLFAPITGFMDLLSLTVGDQSPIELLQGALYTAFGPSGLTILADADSDGDVDRDDVLVTYRDIHGDVVSSLADADAIQINLRLAKSVLFQVPVDFAGALPGLGLDVDANLNVAIGFDFQFGFGLSISDLFYFDVSPQNELIAGLSATFTAGDAINLALGFLSFNVTDLGTLRTVPVADGGYGYGPNFIDWSHFGALGQDQYGDPLTGSGIIGSFELNLRDKYAEDNNDADDAKRLSVLEIGTPTAERPDKNPLTGENGIIEAGVHVLAEADLDMGLELGQGGQFPRIFTEFHFEWEFEKTLIGGAVNTTELGSAPTIEFLAVSLDLGGFISDVLAPILEQVQKVTKPIEPIIDILQMRIPGVSELAGKDITLLDLAGIFGGTRFDPALIKTLIDIVEVINALPTDGSNIIIGFGDFFISGPNAAAGGVDLRDADAKLSDAPEPSRTFDLDNEIANPTGRKKGGTGSSGPSTGTQGFMSKLKNLGGSGLSLPILTDPSNIFGLLTGKVVDLIVWDVPKLHVEFEYSQAFMIFPGLNARFGGSVYVDVNLQLGFDTRGINLFTDAIRENKTAANITNSVPLIFLGLYFGDHIDGSVDNPELVFGAGITAGASLGIGGIVEAGVEGGLFAEIRFDWHDVEKDNKIYVDEFASRFLLSPFAIFDTTGEIYAKLYAFLWVGIKIFGAKITIVDEQFDIIPKIVIADFNYVWNPEAQPVYASMVGSDLRLNMGVDAYHRADDDAPDVDTNGNAGENYEVKRVVLPSSDALVKNGYYAAGEYYHVYYNGNSDKALVDDRDPQAAPGEKTLIPRLYSAGGISRIVANDAGGGNDTIVIDPSINAPVYLRGGDDDDRIVYSGTGIASIYGDGGNDELRGGGGADLIDGGSGNNSIFGGAGDDRIFGGAGADRIFGDRGSDYIEAGEGNDIVFGDTATPFGAVRDASGDGSDVIHGGAGNDALTGQGGNDLLYGEGGDDRMTGNEGDDVLIGGEENDNLAGNEGTDILDGGGGDDAISWTHGDGLDPYISGGSGADTFFTTATSASEDISLTAVNDAPTGVMFTDPAPAGGVTYPGGAVTLTQSNDGLALNIVDRGGVNAPVALTATGFEEMVIDALEGADVLEINDLTGAGLADLRLDLGRSTAVQTVTQAVFKADGVTPVVVPMTTLVQKRNPVTGLLMYETNPDGSFKLDGNNNRIPIMTEALVSEVDADGNPVMVSIDVQDADAVDHDNDNSTPLVQRPKVDADGNPVMIAIQVPKVIKGTVTLDNGEPVTSVLTGPDGPDADTDPDPVLDANGNPIYAQAYTADASAPQVPLLVQQTVTVSVPAGAKDGAADRVVLHGGQSTVHGDQSTADDIFALTAGGGEMAITRDMGANGVMNFTLQNAERWPTTGSTVDELEILGHAGDDILDAGAVAPDSEAPDDRRDLIAIRLFGDTGSDTGNDRLIGSAFNDYLDSGLGNDTVSGLRGVDSFRDAGGFDTLLETNDADMGLFGDTFIVGAITGLGKGSEAVDRQQQPADPLFPAPFVTELTGTGDTWAAGAEVESLNDPASGLIFEKANIKGGDSNNTIVLNDRDNVVHVAGQGDIAVTDWRGYALLDNAANVTSEGNTEAGLNEYYILNLSGGTGARIEIADSGGTSGFNELYLFGSDDPDDPDDIHLDRASGHVTAAMIQIGPEMVDDPLSTDPADKIANANRETVIHRQVNRVNINTLGGDDQVYSDDTAVPVIVHLGAGNDQLTVGTVPQVPDPDNRTIEYPLGVPVADTENMTNGVSATMVVYGEGDDDRFEVNHNAAKLFLHGGENDDTFVINTFITLREMTPEGEAIANLNTLFGGTGNNRYDYVQNAPVFINGGLGTDTIIINGTPIADTFVITRNSVAGAGRVTYFTGVEKLEVNGAAGDDEFFVLSTDPGLELMISGGSGDDTVHLGGEHAPILFDPPPFTYQPPAFSVQDPAIVEYQRYALDLGRITLTREIDYHSGDWHAYKNDAAQFARDVVSSWIANWLFGFEVRPFQDVLTGDPNDAAVQGMTDDARANQGWFGLGGIFDLIRRTMATNTVQIQEISPWWYFWFDERVSISFDMPAFTYRIGNEVLPPPRTVQPAEITVDPPAFAYKIDGVFDIRDIQGKLTIDGGEAFETLGDKLVVHDQQGTVHEGALSEGNLSGFGLGQGTVNGEAFNGVDYASLEYVDLRLSDSATPDVLTIESTHADATRVVLGGGNDIVNVKAVGGTLDIMGGAGDDTVNVHDDGSTLGGIASRVTFDGDAHIAEEVFTLPYDPAIHGPIIASSPYVYIQTDPNGPFGKLFEPAPGTGSPFRYAEETKAQIVFVKDLNANGVADLGDEVWVRAAEVNAAGILAENGVQERGVQEVGFQQTGHQERGYQQRGHQSTGDIDAYGNIIVTNDPAHALLFQLANGDLTFLDTGIQHVTVTNAAADPLLYLDFRSRLTTVDTGTQAVAATGSAGDELLWRDVNGRRTTRNTGVQSIAVTNDASDPMLWIDAGGNLTTVAGNAPVMNGTVQARGVHERTSAQQLLYLTENGTETTAVTDRPKITVTNNKYAALLYLNTSGYATTDPGNRMAIRSAAMAGQLGSHGLAVVSLWVEDDNDRTTTPTQFKSFTGTPDGKDPSTGLDAPLLWTDQSGRKVDIFFEQYDYVTSGGTTTQVLIYRSRPSLLEVQSSIDRRILHTRDLYQTFDGSDTMNIVHLVPDDAPGMLGLYTRAVDQVIDQRIVLHSAGDRATYLGGEAVQAGDPVVVLDGGALKLKLMDGSLVDMPGPDGTLPADVMRHTADADGVVRYAGGELVYDASTLQPVMVYLTDADGDPVLDPNGQPMQVQAVHAAGDPVQHYAGELRYHRAGERREYLGDEPVFGQNGAQVRDVLNNVMLQQAGAPVLGGQPVIVRLGGELYLERVSGDLILITPATVLPADVKRWMTGGTGEQFSLGVEPVYHAGTDPVEANRQFSRLTIGGMPAQLDWAGLDDVTITLGDGSNDLTIESTHTGATTINLEGGADHVRVKSIRGDTTINAGGGDDVIDIWNEDARLYDIDAVLTISGGAPSTSDTMNIVNTLDFDGTPGTLSATTLSGLGMGGQIVYGTIETLNLSLGIGDDNLDILSTAAGVQTNIYTDVGGDTVIVRATGGAGGTTNLFLAEGADTVNVTGSGSGGLQAIQGDLLIADDPADGDGATDVLNITDTTGGDKWHFELWGTPCNIYKSR